MTNSERAAYIRGLMEGLELDPNDKVTKVLNAVSELLTDLSLSVEDLEETLDELGQQVDEIDEDLGDLEETCYGEDSFGCRACGPLDGDAEFQVTCPSCGEEIFLTDDLLDEGAITCPVCGETLEFDLDGEDEGDSNSDEIKF